MVVRMCGVSCGRTPQDTTGELASCLALHVSNLKSLSEDYHFSIMERDERGSNKKRESAARINETEEEPHGAVSVAP